MIMMMMIIIIMYKQGDYFVNSPNAAVVIGFLSMCKNTGCLFLRSSCHWIFINVYIQGVYFCIAAVTGSFPHGKRTSARNLYKQFCLFIFLVAHFSEESRSTINLPVYAVTCALQPRSQAHFKFEHPVHTCLCNTGV
jgi:hypothetical protein